MRLFVLLSALLLGTGVARAEHQRAAVLPFENGRVAVGDAVRTRLAATVRETTAALLSAANYRVLTAESVDRWAAQEKLNLSSCDTACAVDLSAAMELDLYLSGTVSRSGPELIAFVRVMDADHSFGLAAVQLRGATVEALEQQFRAKAAALFARALPDEFGPHRINARAVLSDADRLRGWVESCDGGDLVACNSAAYAYLYGEGAPKDEAKGALYYERTCGKDNDEGCAFLGWVYEKGLGGRDKDEKRAAATYARGCRDGEGYAAACTLLGELHRTGRGVEKDLARAAQLYRDGCDGGDAEACYHLGFAYRIGLGVKQNRALAQELLQKACDEGISDACDENDEE